MNVFFMVSEGALNVDPPPTGLIVLFDMKGVIKLLKLLLKIYTITFQRLVLCTLRGYEWETLKAFYNLCKKQFRSN